MNRSRPMIADAAEAAVSCDAIATMPGSDTGGALVEEASPARGMSSQLAALATGRLAGWIWRLGIVLAVGVSALRGVSEGDFRFTDEPRHAINGTFVLDLVREGGWRDPIRYGEQYYARYPCLTLPYHYPPLFYPFEALFFAVGGVSVATARACVATFHVGAAWLLFEIVRRTHTLGVAGLSAMFFGLCPWSLKVAWWVVLEPPTVFAMLAATWLLLRYEEQPTRARALGWIGGMLAAVLTKQTGVLIVLVHAAYLASKHGRGVLRWQGLWLGLAPLLLGIAGYGTFMISRSLYQMRALTGGDWSSRLSWEHVSFYPYWLPFQLGWALLAAVLVGTVAAVARPRAEGANRLYLIWSAAFFALMILVLNSRTPRYAYLVFPALAVLGGYGVARVAWLLYELTWQPAVPALALAGVLVPFGLESWETTPRIIHGHAEVAEIVCRLSGGSSILVDAQGDGDVVFACRAHDPQRRPVLRGSKILYAYASYRDLNFEEFVRSDAEILEILRRYGTRYVIVDDVHHERTLAGTLLRDLLQGDRFRRIARVPLTDSREFLEAHFLDVYEYLDAAEVSGGELELHFPGLARVIRVALPAARSHTERPPSRETEGTD